MQPCYLCCLTLLSFRKRTQRELLKSPLQGIYSLPFTAAFIFSFSNTISLTQFLFWKSSTTIIRSFQFNYFQMMPFLHHVCAQLWRSCCFSSSEFSDNCSKKALPGSENHLSPFLCCLLCLIAKFPIQRAGQKFIQLYLKLMLDDSALWCGWARTSLSDASYSVIWVLISSSSVSPIGSMLHQSLWLL